MSDRVKVLFFGTPDFSVPTLKALIESPEFDVACVVTQPDRPKGRGNLIQCSPVKKIALESSIPIAQPESIKKLKSGFFDLINNYGPFDVGVVIAFGQILPTAVLDYPKHGCINIHASLLPRWRGAAPIQRALMAGDRETGVALMKMEAELDTGPVYCSERVVIESDDNFESLHNKLAQRGANLLINKLKDIVGGDLDAVPQPQEGISYAHKITNEECELNWQLSASELSNKIRALDPYPGAFTSYCGRRVKIFKAGPASPMRAGKFPAGQITVCDSTRLEVQCGEDVLSITELQLEGRKKMPVAELLKGFSIKSGDLFGEHKS